MCLVHVQHVDEMEGSKFAKLCRDSKLLSKAFTASDVDLYFAKVHLITCLTLCKYGLSSFTTIDGPHTEWCLYLTLRASTLDFLQQPSLPCSSD